MTVLAIDQIGVLPECLGIFLPHRLLKLRNCQRIEQVVLAVNPVLVVAPYKKLGRRFRDGLERVLVLQHGFMCQHSQIDAADA